MNTNSRSSSLFSGRLFFRNCGLVGIAGSLIAIITDFIGIAVVDGYNPITQTISSLAIGDYAWIQDVGLNIYGVSLVIVAIALWRWNLGDWRWRLGAFLTFVMAVDIIIISEHDHYANLPQSSGASVHLYAVYILGVLLPLICFLCSFALRRISHKWQYFSWAIAVLWVIFGPPFFRIPTQLDGLYERFVAAILLCWTIAISWLMFSYGSSPPKKRLNKEFSKSN